MALGHRPRAAESDHGQSRERLDPARERLREIFLGAQMGVTGVNFAIAETGTLVLIEGCGVQIAGLVALVALIESTAAPSAMSLAGVLTVFGYGQGLVMSPLSSAVLSTVKPASAGSGAGMYGTTAQIANAAGVAAIGGAFIAIEAAGSARLALFTASALFALSIVACAAFL